MSAVFLSHFDTPFQGIQLLTPYPPEPARSDLPIPRNRMPKPENRHVTHLPPGRLWQDVLPEPELRLLSRVRAVGPLHVPRYTHTHIYIYVMCVRVHPYMHVQKVYQIDHILGKCHPLHPFRSVAIKNSPCAGRPEAFLAMLGYSGSPSGSHSRSGTRQTQGDNASIANRAVNSPETWWLLTP